MRRRSGLPNLCFQHSGVPTLLHLNVSPLSAPSLQIFHVLSVCRNRNFQKNFDSPYLFYDKVCAAGTTSPAATCNVKGYDRGKPNAYYYDDNAAHANLEQCSAICRSRSCVSFAFGSGACLLYSVRVASNFNAEPHSPYTFYDAACIPRTLAALPAPTSTVVAVPTLDASEIYNSVGTLHRTIVTKSSVLTSFSGTRSIDDSYKLELQRN